MATIGKIRQRSGVVIFIIGAALVLFLLSDVLSNNQSLFGPKVETAVGEIDGEEIDARYFESMYERFLANAKNQRNTKELSSAERTQVNNQTWEYLVEDKLLTNEYGTLGLAITDEELNDAAYGANPHQYFTQIPAFQDESRKFDPARLKEFINNFDQVPAESQVAWNDLMEDVRNDKVRTKYFTMVSKALYMTNLEAKDNYLGQNKQASIKYVRLKTADLSDDNYTVTDEEIRKYAEENDMRYTEDERSVQYVSFALEPSGEDSQYVEDEVKRIMKEFGEAARPFAYARLNTDGSAPEDKFYSISELTKAGLVNEDKADEIFRDSIGTVYTPEFEFGTYKIMKVAEEETQQTVWTPVKDSLGKVIDSTSGLNFKTNYRAAHILIKAEGDTEADTAKAVKEAKDLMKRVKDGESFSDLAMQFGTDGTKAKGGDLGWWEEGGMVAGFQKGVNSMKKGELKVVKTRFGAHLISLTHEPVSVRRKVAIIEKKVTYSEKTANAVYAKAADFWDQAQTAEDYVNATMEMNLNVGVAENMKQGDNTVSGFTDARQLISWAFRQEGVDAISNKPLRIGDKYVIPMLTEIKVKGDLDIIGNETEIEQSIIREKKLDELQEKMKGAYASDLETIASNLSVEVESASNVNFNTPLIANLGSESKVIGAVAALKDGEVSDVIRGEEGVYVVMLEGTSEVELPASFAEYRAKQIKSKATSAKFETLPALKKTVDITDRRFNFY
ncbi:MAG: SurA N-terminal domain-containing protein [Bacteroidia bacterium]